jgi:UDP-N-acetylmuramoylalanine--D-glutamate ligase
MLKNKYNGKKILIAGLGKSGLAALNYLSLLGADISAYDKKDIEWDDPKTYKKLEELGVKGYFNGAEVPDEKWAYIVMSPGMPPQADFVRAGVTQGAVLTGDLELAAEIGAGTFVAITGTNGKTTTTTLTGEMFAEGGFDVRVTGNIGTPVISTVAEDAKDRVYVTEVSSFQLETTKVFKPKVSAILNITPDHLDRHGTVEDYAAAKAKIFENQDENDFFVYNADDPAVTELSGTCRAKLMPFSRLTELKAGAFVKDGKLVIRDEEGTETELLATKELRIPGNHNLENALAAAAIAYCGGVSAKAIKKSLKTFKGVEHRMEPVATLKGVKFVNDSKGTNPDASLMAIRATEPDIILIAGGYDKHSDFHPFIQGFDGKVTHLLLMGATAEQIKNTAEEEGFHDVTVCEDMSQCVRLGFELAKKDDTVLLSPACASWGMYNCFEERGEHFKKCVEELRTKA